jgi:hypothetical protein
MANLHRNISIYGLENLLGERFLYRKAGAGKPGVPCHSPARDLGGEIKKTPQEALRAASTHAAFSCTEQVYASKAGRNGTTAYSVALSDWFGAPRVLEIDVDAWTGRIGETIRVKVRDNIKVAGVIVAIHDEEGNLLETGEAVQTEAGSPWWSYVTKSRLRMTPFPHVEATAWDLAGNRDSFVIN